MKRSLLIAFILLSTTVHARKIMLTAFEPFGGRTINSSLIAAQTLARNHTRDGIEYEVCVLPVEYDNAARAARACHARMNPKPDMVVSLGEGGESVDLETRAWNYDDTAGFADNAGSIRENRTIDVNTTPFELLTLPAAEMFCAADAIRIGPPVNASTSPGYYVCNNTAYHLARYFKPQNVPYGFIHVPATDQEGSEIAALTLDRMLRAGMNTIARREGEDCNEVISLSGLSEIVRTSTDAAQVLCTDELQRQVADVYEVPIRRASTDDGTY